VLGVLLITGEYATGMIRTSIAAVPRRLPVLWGKAIAFALTTLALCVPATFAAFLLGQSILSAEQLDTTLGHPGAARAVLGSALYLTAVGLLGLGLGALLRNTAGAISALFGVLFGLQIVAGFLPDTWSDEIYKYLPTPAGVAVTNVRPDPASSDRGPGSACSASTPPSCWGLRPGNYAAGTPDAATASVLVRLVTPGVVEERDIPLMW
jgi:ABC-2 type transport system permease protein